jgi:hypothetical protein
MPAQVYILGDSNGQKYVIADGATVDDIQASGRWLATREPVEVEP